MSRCGDRDYVLETEVPARLRTHKGEDKASRGGIYVDRNIVACAGVKLLKGAIQRLDIVVESRPGNTRNRHYTYSILVAMV